MDKSDKSRLYPLALAPSPQKGCLSQGSGGAIPLALDENRLTLEIDNDVSLATLQRLVLALEQI